MLVPSVTAGALNVALSTNDKPGNDQPMRNHDKSRQLQTRKNGPIESPDFNHRHVITFMIHHGFTSVIHQSIASNGKSRHSI